MEASITFPAIPLNDDGNNREGLDKEKQETGRLINRAYANDERCGQQIQGQ